MDDSTEISFSELRTAVGRLLDAAERRFGPRLELDADHYWSIYPSDAFNLEAEPEVVAGQISDDVATIRETAARLDADEDDLLLWHDLDHLVGILLRISSLTGA